MPTPKLFKKFSSKSNTPESSSTLDASPNYKEDAPQATIEPSEDTIPSYSDHLKEAWEAAHKELPRAQGAEKVLNKIASVQESLTLSSGQQSVVDTLATPTKALMHTSELEHITGTIHKGVDTFMEAIPPLMKALDEVAKIHPFINVAVLAFKAVYTLEKKRRENDKRVLALYLEMKDMMAVLINLNGVTDPKKIAPDGQTIEGRMQKLCEDVAEDIKKCANACDAYLKKKLLVKVFAGPIWEGRLLEFVGVFTKRRGQFEFAMAIRTTAGIDAANLKLDTVNEQTVELSRKMDLMLQLFQEFVPPQQKELADKVKNMGGDAALEDEQAMEELVGVEFDLTMRSGGQSDGGRPFDLIEFRQEIKDDPDEAIQNNAEFFSSKFEIQRREIQDVARAVQREGDRIILAITAGPHDRIADPDIYNIWKDMGWRGSVKAQKFVMTLKDYFVEKTTGDSGSLMSPDGWALNYINIGRARGILEAFDDDAGGFVSINEVNTFTRSRPLSWSLPHWIAYWAIGWQMTCTTYCVKIEEIFDAMIRLAYEVLPENREAVKEYIHTVWQMVTVFVQSFKRGEGTEDLRSKFELYVAAEEKRLRRNFEEIKYRIDDSYTVRVIAGEGRVEMTLLPMFYLVLKRDLEKISLARKHVLSDRELSDARRTVWSIVSVALDRIESLRSTFLQQNLKTQDQFEVFAEGLYNFCSTHGPVFEEDQFKELNDPIPCRDELIPDPDSIPLSVLNQPLGKRHEINFAAYDLPEPTLPPTEGDHPGLGMYYGFLYYDGKPTDPMIKFTLKKGENENAFVADGAHYQGVWYKKCNFAGNWSPPSEDGKIPVEFKISYGTDTTGIELKGMFDPEENSLRGTLIMPYYQTTGEFVFKRDPDFVRFYPAPSVINARKRWVFALALVLDRVRRQTWSPTQISERIKNGRRFMELTIRHHYGKRVTEDERAEYLALLPGLYEADVDFYTSLIDIHVSKRVVIRGSVCRNCFSSPTDSKVVCIDCESSETMNLCSEPTCVNCTVALTLGPVDRRKIHLPNHGMFKVRRHIFSRDIARIQNVTRDTLELERANFSLLKEEGYPIRECLHCKTALSLPCWCCLECTEDRFICDNCEHKNLALGETHTEMHTVVRITEEEKKRLTEERLQFLEDKLMKIEGILAKLVGGDVEGSRTDPLAKGDTHAAGMT